MSAALRLAALGRPAAVLLLGLTVGLGVARWRAAGAASTPVPARPVIAAASGIENGEGESEGRSARPVTASVPTVLDDAARIVLRTLDDTLATAESRTVTFERSREGAGRIRGRVRTPSGAGVAGARVEAICADDEQARPGYEFEQEPLSRLRHELRFAARSVFETELRSRVAISGEDGAYEIADLPAGHWMLTAERPGFKLLRVASEEQVSRSADLAAHDAPSNAVKVGPPGDASGGEREGTSTDGEVRVDFVATRLVPVRFELAGTGGRPIEWGHLSIDGLDRFRRPLHGSVLEEVVTPGTFVVQASVYFGDSETSLAAGARSLRVPFQVAEHDGPRTVVVPFPRERGLAVRVISDDPEGEAWHQVEVTLRRADDGGAPLVVAGPAPNEGSTVRLGEPAPGVYEVTARRTQGAARDPGPPVRVVVPVEGIVPAFAVSLPPSGRTVRVTVTIRAPRGVPEERAEVRLTRISVRPGDPDNRGGAVTDPVRAQRETPASSLTASFRASRDFWIGPPGARVDVLAEVEIRDFGSASAVVPQGEDVAVEVEVPPPAQLALRVRRGAHGARTSILDAYLKRPEVERFMSIGHQVVGADGAALLGPVAAGPYRLSIWRRPTTSDGPSVLLTERAVFLHAGENSAEVDLPGTSTVTIEGLPPGSIKVYRIGERAQGTIASDHAVGDSGEATVSALLEGTYVALHVPPRDPFSSAREPKSVRAMVFTVGSASATIRFEPASTEGWHARAEGTCGCIFALKLRHGDVVREVDGRPIADLTGIASARALEAGALSPGTVRLGIVRDGSALTIEAPLEPFGHPERHYGFLPVPP